MPTLVVLCSAALNRPVMGSLVVLGEMSIGGALSPVDHLADVLQVAHDAGARKVLIPISSAGAISTVPTDLLSSFSVFFYATPEEAVLKALGVEQRRQQLYRDRQLDLWDHACAVTGCALPELLVASHAKPWAASSPAERLDPYNGFPLEARFDRLFDQGLITFTDTGTLVLSSALDSNDRALLNLHGNLHLRHSPTARHLPYIHYHREHIFIP